MGRCLTEERIEQIAIAHLSDSGSVLPDHLRTCEFCQSVFNAISDLHKDAIEGVSKIKLESNVQRVNTRLKSLNPHVFRLHAVEVHTHETAKPIFRNTLAADSQPTIHPTRVKNLGVFASSDGRLMVRIIKGIDGFITLFLLSDQEAFYKHVLVRILGLDREYVTDINGSVQLGEIDLPDILELGIEVRTASEKYDLKTLVGNRETLIGEGEIVLSRESSKQVKMEIIPVGGLYSLKVTLEEHTHTNREKRIKVMVVRNDNPPLVQSSIHGVALFQELIDPYAIQVNIFE